MLLQTRSGAADNINHSLVKVVLVTNGSFVTACGPVRPIKAMYCLPEPTVKDLFVESTKLPLGSDFDNWCIARHAYE